MCKVLEEKYRGEREGAGEKEGKIGEGVRKEEE